MILRLLILLLTAGALAGCSDEAQFGATPREHHVLLHEGWEHRWGDSPFDAQGRPRWATEDLQNPAWVKQAFPEWPTDGKPGQTNLWQRVKLPELKDDGQALFLRTAWMLFEAYVDGERIYAYGTLDKEGKGHFTGQAWHWLPLKKAWSGKYLTFRFYSDDGYIGLYDGVHLGTKADHVIWMFKRDIWLIVMGAIYIFLGLITIFMFTRNRAEKVNVSFGTFAVAIGLYELCRTYLKQFLLHDPALWGVVELTSLYLVPVCFFWFTEHLLGPGPFKVTRRFWQFGLLFIAYSYGLLLVLGKSLWTTLYAFQYFFLICGLALLLIIGRAAVKGGLEARTFFGGVMMVVLAAIHDVLGSLGVIKSIGLINHVGSFFLICSLAAIVGRRYFLTIAIQKNLELASAVQNLLLPKQKGGEFGAFTYASYYEPHGRMSGDWMNFWTASDGEQRLLFGDVIGKGPRAALAVAAIAAFIENSKDAAESLDDCINRVNTGLFKLFGSYITSTLSAVALKADGTLDLYNCGGIGWVRAGRKSELISMPSSVLGFEGMPQIARRALTLEPGEFVFAFTDGVLEGTKSITKLVRALNERMAVPGRDVRFDELFEVAATAGAGRTQADDRSILAVQKRAA